MVARTFIALALLAAGASASNLAWNGKAASFTEASSWDGPSPGADEDQPRPKSIVFGSDQTGKTITANVPSSETAYVGLKIEFRGAGKIVLGDGSGKAKLSFAEGGNDVSTFIPGSDMKFSDDTQAKLQAFDLNCHRNWVSTSDADSVPMLPPCGGDRAYIYSDVDGVSTSAGTEQPSNINVGDMIWASNFAKKFKAKIYLQEEVGGGASSVDKDDCVKDIISTSVATLDLKRCGSTVTFGDGSSTGSNECVTTCPPFAVLADGSYIQSDEVDEDGSPVYKRIAAGKKGAGTATTDVVTLGEEGSSFTVKNKADNTVASYVKDGKAFTVVVTTTAAEETTTAEGKTTMAKKGKDDDKGDDNDDDDDDDDDKYNDDKSAQTTTGGGLGPNTGEKSSGDKKKDDDSTTIIVVVVVVLILIIAVIGGALFYIKSQNKDAGGRNVVSFENPMYDTQGQLKQNPVQGAGGYADPGAGGYQDVQGHQQGDATYAEPFQGQQQQQAANSGYMDVQGATPGAGATGGYMDVKPTATVNMGDESDGEDV